MPDLRPQTRQTIPRYRGDFIPALQVDLDAQDKGGGRVIAVPQSTVEKPLTSVDYIAILPLCGDVPTLMKLASALPPYVVADDRFAQAFKKRLAELHTS